MYKSIFYNKNRIKIASKMQYVVTGYGRFKKWNNT
jgi:hypothetical protein